MSRSESSREVSVTTSSDSRSAGASRDDLCRGLLRLEALRVDDDLRVGGRFVRVVDAREALDLARERLRVEPVDVTAGALVERRADVDLDKRAVLLDEGAGIVSGLLVGRDRGHDGRASMAGDPRGDPPEPLDVGVTVLLRETEALREMGANGVAVQVLDDVAAAVELRADVVRDRRLARSGEAREPESEASAAVGLRLGVLVRVDVLTHAVLSRFVFSWMPHSSLSEPAQRPARSSSSGLVGRVHGMHPIER
jgi:hypothetical protein